MKKGNAKRVFALLLTVIMTLGTLTAGLTFFAGAADGDGWVQVSGGTTTTYSPVNIFEMMSTNMLESNNVYLIKIEGNFINTDLSVSNSIEEIEAGQTSFYTLDKGSYTLYSAKNKYVLSSNIVASDYMFEYRDNCFYNSHSGKYLTAKKEGPKAILDLADAANNTWTVGSVGERSALTTVFDSKTYSIRNESKFELSERTNYVKLSLYQMKTVYEKSETNISGFYKHNGNSTFYTLLNNDFNEADILKDISVLYKATENGSQSTLNISDPRVSLVWDSEVDTSSAGTYTAKIYAGNTQISSISVEVTDSLPYPEPGSVKIDKTASGDYFNEIGVGEVELSAMGVPPFYESHVDVLFVTDLSNSMNWVSGTSNYAGNNQSSKLNDMQAAVEDFAEAFLEPNEDGDVNNNTISFVTFGGFDKDYISGNFTYADITRTLYTSEDTVEGVMDPLYNIKYKVSNNEVYISFDGTTPSTDNNHKAYGGTNYDYGFMEATKAIEQIKQNYEEKTGQKYEDADRGIYVIFVTDGAPTHYNGDMYRKSADDRADKNETWINQNGRTVKYNSNTDYSKENWYNHIKSIKSYWATQVFNTSGVEGMSVMGVDLANGGFNNWVFSDQDLSSFVSNIVDGQTLDVYSVSGASQMANALLQMEGSILSGGGEETYAAYVLDTMGAEYNLQMKSTVTDSNGNTIKLSDYGITSKITISEYNTYHADEVGTVVGGVTVTTDMVGTRKSETPSVIEEVTFNAAGTAAYSSLSGSTNILSNGIIDAENFIYNSTSSAVTINGIEVPAETFLWKFFKLQQNEKVLSYNVYLDSSMTGGKEEGSYDTNESAVLTYKDVDGNQHEKTYPVPELEWGKAKISYELYLVDEEGNPIDENGNSVTFENRTEMSELVELIKNLNSGETIDKDKLQELLPTGYFFYNEDAAFDVYLGSADNGSASISDTKKNSNGEITTKVFYPENVQVDGNGNVIADKYTDLKVAFAIYTVKINPIVVVMDYGKPITTYPLEKDYRGFNVNGITAERPGSDVKTTNKLTLNNGVAVLDESVTPELPTGDLVAKIGVNDTKIFYPETEKTTTVAYSANLRYQFTNGKIEKYEKYAETPADVTDGLADKKYAVDTVNEELKYAFYRDGDYIYVMKNPQVIEGTTPSTPSTPGSSGESYYEFTGNTISETFTRLDTSSSRQVKTIVTLPDGTYFGARGSSYYTDARIYVYLNDSSDSFVTLTSSNSPYTTDVTLTGYKDKSGNDLVVPVTFEWTGQSDQVKYSYPEFTERVPATTTYQQLTGEKVVGIASKQISSKDSSNPDVLCELPDGSVIYGYHNFVQSDSDYRYVYVKDGSASSENVLELVHEQSGSFKHTVKDAYDKDGNPLVINVYVTKSAATDTASRTVKVEYDAYETVTVQVPTETEKTVVMRNTLDSVTYTPFKYMSSIDRLYFYVTKDGEEDTDETVDRLYSTITYIPATTVYYEDNFGGIDENGLYIHYSGDWYTVSEDGSKVLGTTAKVDSDEYQDRGEVGDGHTPYGHDSSYDGDVKFSDGTAAFVEGTISLVNNKPQYDATAEFTFTGTGFDLISRTDMNCGQIIVQIFYHEGHKRITNVPVINKGVDDLYQIPVISYTGLAYNTYDVTINVSGPSGDIFSGIGNDFYLDAIRIYDPMGTKSGDNPEFDEAYNAYCTDKEANPYIASIRDFIISTDTLGDLGDLSTEINGAVYVDTINNDYIKTEDVKQVIGNIKKPTYTNEQKRWRDIDPKDLNTFELVGPNEEVYLTPGYGVGFKIEATKRPDSVQLGIKIPKAIATPKSTLTAQTYGHSKDLITFDVKSADEMFYDITDAVVFDTATGKYTATVIISNGVPSSDDDIVSITNLKMTFSDENKDVTVTPVNEKLQSVEAPLVKGDEEPEEPVVTLKASQEIYKQVFDTIYVQRIASMPDNRIENLECDETVCKGGYMSVKFNTAASVQSVEILDENGKALEIAKADFTVSEEKRFTDDYQNTKSWTVKVRVLKDEGNHEFTVKAADSEDEGVKIPVTVTPAEIAELRVAKMPAKTEFNYGEELDFGGLEIEAIYTDDTVEKITEGFEFTESENEHGVKTITATYGDVSVEFDVNVVPVITGIRVGKAPETTEYKYESKLDAKGLELIVTYSDGSEKTVTEGFKLSKDTADTEGKMTVGVEYEGFETSFDVNVKLTFWQKIVRFVKNVFTTVKDLFAKIF